MSDTADRYDRGMEIRRLVLGDAHVDKALAATGELDADFQTWITENVWAQLWGREGLTLRERSLITIAILAALGREELTLHLEAARNTGAAAAEIRETLLHVAVYAGVPAANQAFKLFKDSYEGGER